MVILLKYDQIFTVNDEIIIITRQVIFKTSNKENEANFLGSIYCRILFPSVNLLSMAGQFMDKNIQDKKGLFQLELLIKKSL